MFERMKAKRRENKLNTTRRQLEDALYNLKEWSFADTPSRMEDRLNNIYGLIRRFEDLGGDALALMPYGNDYLVAEAMPEKYERVNGYSGWQTLRKELEIV